MGPQEVNIVEMVQPITSVMRISDAESLCEQVRTALAYPGPLLVDVQVMENEALFPKSAALPQADGSFRSMLLEDISPLLSREELRANMVVPLDPASENVPTNLISTSRTAG